MAIELATVVIAAVMLLLTEGFADPSFADLGLVAAFLSPVVAHATGRGARLREERAARRGAPSGGGTRRDRRPPRRSTR